MHIRLILVFGLLSSIWTIDANSQPRSLVGSWLGVLALPSGPDVRLGFTIREDTNGQYRGTWSSPDQTPLPGDIGSIRFDHDTVRLALKVLNGLYAGVMSKDGSRIEGSFSQGFPIPLTLLREKSYVASLEDTAVAAPMKYFHLALKIAKDSNRWLGTVEVIDMGEEEYSIDSVTATGDSLRFVVPNLDGEFVGALERGNPDGFDGVWRQDSEVTSGRFAQVQVVQELVRPQEPRPHYPYKEDSVSYLNKRAGIVLAGTLTEPFGKGPFPAVFLILGSGPHDRDEAIMGHKPFKVIADYLTRHGIAVLRADDRGVGSSGGTYNGATSANFATDAKSAVEFLKSRPEIDRKHIGLIGHSEGGMIAPMVAARDTHSYSAPNDVAFIVLLAAPGIHNSALMMLQRSMLAKNDTSKKMLNQLRYSALMDAVLVGTNQSNEALLSHRLDSLWKRQYAEGGGDTSQNSRAKSMRSKAATFTVLLSPWYRFFIAYDPATALRKVSVPVLALNGTLDRQVACEVDLQGISRALKEGNNKDVTIKKLPGLNHLFQHAQTGSVDEYAMISETFSPEVLDIMCTWILKHSNK